MELAELVKRIDDARRSGKTTTSFVDPSGNTIEIRLKPIPAWAD